MHNVNNESEDKPVHSCSLISKIVVYAQPRLLVSKAIVFNLTLLHGL